jgi:acyl-CoA synthetase (AMP-forming)/AMP-acid ligase II
MTGARSTSSEMTASLAELLAGHPDEVVAISDERNTTRRELQRAAACVSADLRAHATRGRAIGVCLPNVPEAIAAWFGVWQARATFVPLNPRVPDAELVRAIAATGVSAVVTTEDRAAQMSGDTHAVAGTPLHVVGLAPAQPRAVTPDQAIVQFTSGTTGTPKAVVLRHDTVSELLDTVIGSLRGARRSDQARMPNLVPMSLSLWAGIYQVLFAFKLGAPVVLMPVFEPQAFARLVRQHGIRSSVLPPAALVMLTDDPAVESLEPLRYVRSVSAPLSPVHARRFHERFGVAILNGYGQTELGGEAIGWSAADWKEFGEQKLGAVGRPHAAFRLRVRTERGAIGDTDEVGELEIRSSSALPPDDAAMEGRVTDDGWLRTGDLARIDADGFVWIEGRVSAMINRGGLKVFPDEVEECIRRMPAVSDVAVAGVPDARLGEVPWAFVVGSVELVAMQEHCRAELAPYKVPAGLTIVGDLPRNEMGKVLRQHLVPRASPAC